MLKLFKNRKTRQREKDIDKAVEQALEEFHEHTIIDITVHDHKGWGKRTEILNNITIEELQQALNRLGKDDSYINCYIKDKDKATVKFDYNKIFEIKEINLGALDNVTLIDWEILELGYNELGDRTWLCIEVWEDEGNAIKILEQDEYDTEEITHKLTKKQKEHIYNLVYKAMRKEGL